MNDIKWHQTERICPKCKQHKLIYRIKESFDGAYEDIQYWCQGCNHTHWIDSVDS